MMRGPLVIILAAICVSYAPVASARIGETERELVHRYGSIRNRFPARQTAQGRTYTYGEYLHFQSDDWRIRVLLLHGTCEEIAYSKDGLWTEAQLNHLLELNGGRDQWEEQKPKNALSSRTWIRRDKTVAVFHAGVLLEFQTPVVKQTRDAIDRAAKEAASKLPKF